MSKVSIKKYGKTRFGLEVFTAEDGTEIVHRDYIRVGNNLKSIAGDGNEYEVVSTNVEYCTYLTIKVGTKKIIIHPFWIDTVDGSKVSKKLKNTEEEASKTQRINGEYFIKLSPFTLIHSDDIRECVDCNEVISDVTEYGGLCRKCFLRINTELLNYNYKPSNYNFIGKQIKADEETPIWYGMELEYGVTDKMSLAKVVSKHKEHLYLKSDTTISGGDFRAEMVTHPQSFKQLMGSTSFLKDISGIKVEEVPQCNGCHIHVSRTAWKDDRHYGLWYFLIHQLEELSVFVGGRQLTSYCAKSPTQTIAKKKKDGIPYDARRQSMVNETNTHTIECRFFASTTSTDRAKAYVQYLESLIKYTKYHSRSVSGKGFIRYINRQSTKYVELLKLLESFSGNVDTTVTYRQPRVKEYKLTVLPYKYVNKVSGLLLSDGNKIYIREKSFQIDLYDGEECVYYTTTRGESRRIEASKVLKVVIEE